MWCSIVLTPWWSNLRSFPPRSAPDAVSFFGAYLCARSSDAGAVIRWTKGQSSRKGIALQTAATFKWELGDAWCEVHRTKCRFTFHWAIQNPSPSRKSDLKLELAGVHPIRIIRSVNNWQFESMCLGDWLSAVHYLQSNSQLSIMPPTHQTEQTFGHLDTWGNKTAAVSCHPQKLPIASLSLWKGFVKSFQEGNEPHTRRVLCTPFWHLSVAQLALTARSWALRPCTFEWPAKDKAGSTLDTVAVWHPKAFGAVQPKERLNMFEKSGDPWFKVLIHYSSDYSDPFQRTSAPTDAQPSSSACAWLNKLIKYI